MKKKVLLVIGGGLGNGGVQAVVMGIVRNLKDEIDFDVVLFTDEVRHYDEEFLKYGQIFRISKATSNSFFNRIDFYTRFLRIYKGIYTILIKNGPYTAIHCHNMFEAGICCYAAYKAGVMIRITHSHSGNRYGNENLLRRVYENYLRFLIGKYSNVKIGCSLLACDYLYGEKNNEAFVVNNFVDFEKFNIDKYKKEESDLIRFVHIGNYIYQKNQLFLLEVFKNIHHQVPNSKLTLVGSGEDKEKICSKINELKLSDAVSMAPHNSDIPYILSQSDYMILPSRYEGLPLVLLEAQAMRVPCFVSERVTSEADVGLCTYIPLEDGSFKWADIITNSIKSKENKWLIREDLLEKFEIKNVMNEYRRIYNANKAYELINR